MEVVSLNTVNYTGLTASYSQDQTLKFDQDFYYTDQGLNFSMVKALALANDTTTNNYSNLFLTQLAPLTSSLYIEDLRAIPDDGITTYLAIYATGGIGGQTQFLVVEEPAPEVATASTSMSGTSGSIDNRYFFTVRFHDADLCKIEHVNADTARYLTANVDASLNFTYDISTDWQGDLSPQLFNYIYDRSNNAIVFYKNLNDAAYYVGASGTKLSLIEWSLTATDIIPYTEASIFSCVPRPNDPNNTQLIDSWVSYKRNFKTNTQDIEPDRSVLSVNSNLILNNEFANATSNSFDLNALSLKNTSTPENYQSRNNPFGADKSVHLLDNEIDLRDYKKLYTGSHQTRGSDNITVGYESYTTDIVLAKDKITHFHVPYNLYPFKQLNVAESGLIQAGAIAGDHPIKSDKIFKKLANAETTSPFGAAADEAMGSFLCSWLSGGADINVPPVWVDRYYNPSKLTFISALTARSLKAITYNPVFNIMIEGAGDIPGTDDVFDKPSGLVFEPGCYYAYHHYGPSDVEKYLQVFKPYLEDQDFQYYYDTNVSNVLVSELTANEYLFNGTNYAITSPLTGIQNSNQFTLAFDMYNKDWSKPFGYQVIGNFLNDGFGIFNENIVTPTFFINAPSALNIFNTDLNLIKNISYTSTPRHIIRAGFTDNYALIYNNGFLEWRTFDDIVLTGVVINDFARAVDFISTGNTTAYVLCSGTTITNPSTIYSVDLLNVAVTQVSLSEQLAYYTIAAGGNDGIGRARSYAKTIDHYNNALYFTEGTVARRLGTTIYYLPPDGMSLNAWYDIDTSSETFVNVLTAFKIKQPNTKFVDFNIDFDKNLWLFTNNAYYKYTTNKEFLLSGVLTSDTATTNTVYITGNGSKSTFTITNSGSLNASDYVVRNNNNYRLLPAFDYTINSNNIVFINPPLSGAIYSIARSYTIDCFNNYKVNFISEFANSTYYDRVLFTRTGYLTGGTSLSPGYQFILTDMYGAPLSSTFFVTQTADQKLVTNTDYLREYVYDNYPDASLSFKAVTTNVYNTHDNLTSEIIFNLSALDPGYHHFAVRFDSYHGYMMLFVDGQRVQDVQFPPRKYKFSNIIYRPFIIGSACFNNSVPLFEHLQKISYLTENIKIKNFYLYSTPLNDYDIIMHARKGADIQDIHFDVPCGRRNYLEEIERYFKATVPGGKSTQYNVLIRNTGITDTNLRIELEKRILLALGKSAPAYSKLNTIKWIN
jgi:hypothetical protein